jgi:hypothetical protein
MDKKQNNEVSNLKFKFQESAEHISYSNFALINNSSEEFLLDFGNITPGKEGIEVFSRIALSPRNAKLFLMGLGERVKKFEQAFGEIKLPENGKTEERK